MTSRVSYFKIACNSMKRRLWYGAVIFLLLFLGMPIKAMLELESVSEINARCADAAQRIEETGAVRRMFDTYVCGGDFLLFFMIVGAALLGAWSGLYWLHSKKKMDMLGSLPLKRGKLFLVSSVNTFVLFAVPFLVNMILLVLVGASKGILSGDTFGYVIEGIGVGVLFFAVHYLCAALAMLLTGKLITGILGTMVFLSIIPIIHGVLESYPSIFWKTYVESNLFENAARYFESPTMAYLYTVESLENLDSLFSKNSSAWLLFVSAFLMLVIFAGVCMWLIKIRPSEGAEKAMVFPKTEGIIKAVILFALSMGGGIFFMSIGRARGEGEHGGFWFWFGLIFVWILGSILIEVIYSFDRKKIFDHKIWTGAAGLVVLGVAVFFSFDLSGYDKWIPSQDEVAHATADAEVRYVTYPDGSGNSLEFMENHLSEFTGTAVFKLSENGVQNVNAEEDEDGEWTYVTVLYQMKNGSVKKRTYPVDREIVLETQQELYKEKAYKEAMFPIALSKPEDVEPGYLRFMGRSLSLENLSKNEQKELLGLYQQELAELTYQQIHALGSGSLTFLDQGKDYLENDYPLNENFTQTVDFLRQMGYDVIFDMEDITDIQSITIYDYRENNDADVDGTEATMTDPELIKEARVGLLSTGEYGTFNYNPGNLQGDVSMEVAYKLENGDSFTVYCAYEKGKIPEVVEEFLKSRGNPEK